MAQPNASSEKDVQQTPARGNQNAAGPKGAALTPPGFGPGPAAVGGSDNDTKLEQLRLQTRLLANQLATSKARRDSQEAINSDQWAVSSVSEVVGSVAGAFKGKGLHGMNLPDKSIWNESDRLLKAVQDELAGGNVIRAAHALQALSEAYTKAQTQLNEYLEGVIGGAEITTTGLKVAAAAGAIAATIATGGIAGGAAVPMLGITAGAGMGLLGTSAAIGVGAGVYGLTQETASQTTEVIIGTRKAIDEKAILTRAGKDAILGFVGSLAGGMLAKYAMRYFARAALARMTQAEIALVAERFGVDATRLTPQVFLSKGQQFLIDFFAGTATTPLTSAVEITLNRLAGEPMPSPQQFAEMVIDNAVKGGLVQLFLAPFTHGGLLKSGSGHEPIPLPDAPPGMVIEPTAHPTAKGGAKPASPPAPEIPLQNPQETLADLQGQSDATFTPKREPIPLPDAPAELSLQSSQETTASLQTEVGTPKPGPGQPEIGPEAGGKPMEFRKTKAAGSSKNPRKAELQQTEVAAKQPVAVGKLIESGKVQPTAQKPANLRGQQRSIGGEEQLQDIHDWKQRRGEADKLRREASAASPKQGLKAGDPDPAFPGETVSGVHEDHIVPARTIRDMRGFASLDLPSQIEILNTPENLELVSEKVNQSRGDKTYDEWSQSETGQKADAAWVAEMSAKEKQLTALIQSRIDALLREQMRRDWWLRLGMPSF